MKIRTTTKEMSWEDCIVFMYAEVVGGVTDCLQRGGDGRFVWRWYK